MARSLNLYLRPSVKEIERIVEDYRVEFNQLLEDTLSDDELLKNEDMIDAIAAVYPQAVSNELSFEDFCPDPLQETQQRLFFDSVKSSICLENMPYLESNPFQVTYLSDLLWSFDEVLIDRGGMNELMFRKEFLEELKGYKTIDSLISGPKNKIIEVKSSIPVTPIDFIIADIYKELERLKNSDVLTGEMPEKVKIIFSVMKSEKLDGTSIFRKSGLIPKDFDDTLERLKFWLKKL